MKRFLFLLAAVAVFAAPAPALALTDAERAAGYSRYDELADAIEAAFDMSFDGKAGEAHGLMLEIADKARAARAQYAAEPELATAFDETLGVSLFYAAQFHDHEWDNLEKRMLEVAWLAEAAAALDRAVTELGPLNGPTYELRGAAGQLFDHGAYLEEPRWREWSALNVRGNRAMLARLEGEEDTAFERNMVAQALYMDGFLTANDAEIAEANALAEDLGDALEYRTERMRDAVAAGEAPYAGPGETFW